MPDPAPIAAEAAEKALLAAALIDEEALDLAALPPEAFYVPEHAALWRALLELRREGKPLDITAALTRANLPLELGVEIMTQPVSAFAAREYAEQVREAWVRRRLMAALAGVYAGLQEGRSVGQALADLARMAQEYAVGEGEGPLSLYEASQQLLEELRLTLGGGRVGAVGVNLTPEGATGEELLSVAPGELHLLAASTGAGKSAIALQIARALAPTGPVLIYSLEMRAQDWAARYWVQEGALSMREARYGPPPQKLGGLEARLHQVGSLPIYVRDDLHTREGILMDIRRQRRRLGALYFIVDYLGLVEMPQAKGEKRYQALEDLAMDLKRVALEMGVAVIGIHQLNRMAETERRSGLSAWGDSYSMLRPADGAYVLVRHRGQDGSRLGEEAEWRREKVRNGPLGVVRLRFDPERLAFSEAVSEAV